MLLSATYTGHILKFISFVNVDLTAKDWLGFLSDDGTIILRLNFSFFR